MAASEENDLSIYQLTAVNFAQESTNKIHSDKVARQYGFEGALVPGIAIYAYMTHPVVERLGCDWLERGVITAKFIKPVYAGERVRVHAKTTGSDANEVEIQVLNHEDTVCAVGRAGFRGGGAKIPRALDYQSRPLVAPEERIPPSTDNLPPGTPFGTLNFDPEADEHESKVHDHYLDNLAVYKGPGAACHPAYLLAQANQILMRNVNLGPWIHTRSRVENFFSPRTSSRLNIRGYVARSYKKRGHELVDLDLAIFDSADRGIATIKHTAIVRLKSPEVPVKLTTADRKQTHVQTD